MSKTTKTPLRVYRVGDRLVRATHPSHALMHVARDTHQVRVATQDDMEALLLAGTRVEELKAEQQALPTDSE